MIRYLSGLLVVVLVGVPLLQAPSELIAGVAAVAGALCVWGVATLSIALLAAGASLALAEYTLALWMTTAPLDFVGAIGLGVTLWLLLETTGFAGRLRGVAVAREVFREQAHSWIATGVAFAGLAGVAAIVAETIGLQLPGSAYPAAAALGALAAFLGAVRALVQSASGGP